MPLIGVVFLILILVTLFTVDYYAKRPPKPEKPAEKERRAYPRYKTSLRIRYKTPSEEGVSWIKDISEGGARLFLNKTLKTLNVGESLGIEISLPNDTDPIVIEGNIVWSTNDDAGFNFDKILQGDVNRIIQHINSANPITSS